ncbi:rhamnosyltransferase [Leptospira ryugenii]|uniref:Rhamnosyltransferase n=1 Tax=Leptospira ryugenii TaxID=1917863 RepID=A0A2P2DW59_9LEPT|nr:glycosyltransferase family 2 protein [Leptospira ryugenii]GBF48856.1 rhamnosyltransferase [Leptospira ryugenii]
MLETTFAISIAYYPDVRWYEQLKELKRQNLKVILVCNSQVDRKSVEELCFRQIQNDSNVGLAHAVNQGVSFALEKGATQFFLFDQDSIPDKHFVATMLSCLQDLQRQKGKIACLGSLVVNETNESIWPYPLRLGGKLQFVNTIGEAPIPIDFAISSGTLIPAEVWKEVGPYREDFFIDGLDIEWGYRALHFGYQSFINFKSSLFHRLGENTKPLYPFSKTKVIVHTPIRRYYIYRNLVWMMGMGWIPKDFKIHYVRKLTRYLLWIFASPHQWSSIPKLLQGFWDAVFRSRKPIKNS